MTTIKQLEELAKVVCAVDKDDWELKKALLKFDAAANPQTILELCAAFRQVYEALDTCAYRTVIDGDGYFNTEFKYKVFDSQLVQEALTRAKELME